VYSANKISQIYLVIFIITILSLFSALFAYKRFLETQRKLPLVVEMKKSPAKFSRVTFFKASPPFCSLAIPEGWEGNYRMSDESGRVVFNYFDEEGQREIFRVNLYDEVAFLKNKQLGELELLKKDGKIYSYFLSTGQGKSVKKYVDMRGEVVDIIKSFTCRYE